MRPFGCGMASALIAAGIVPDFIATPGNLARWVCLHMGLYMVLLCICKRTQE